MLPSELLQFTVSVVEGGGWQRRKPESGWPPLSSGRQCCGGELGGSEARLGLGRCYQVDRAAAYSKREATFHLRSSLFPPRRDLAGGCSQRAVLHLRKQTGVWSEAGNPSSAERAVMAPLRSAGAGEKSEAGSAVMNHFLNTGAEGINHGEGRI